MNLKVIYLPTEQLSGILNTPNGLELVDVLDNFSLGDRINLDLANFENIYIVDLDGEINKFDWYIDSSKSTIIHLVNALKRRVAEPLIYSKQLKVIASTNIHIGLPKLSKEFVKNWIDNPIGEVVIEDNQCVWKKSYGWEAGEYKDFSLEEQELINYNCTGFTRECPTVNELTEFFNVNK